MKTILSIYTMLKHGADLMVQTLVESKLSSVNQTLIKTNDKVDNRKQLSSTVSNCILLYSIVFPSSAF
jgi:hypothetical protein